MFLVILRILNDCEATLDVILFPTETMAQAGAEAWLALKSEEYDASYVIRSIKYGQAIAVW